jgi:hypothetical protein
MGQRLEVAGMEAAEPVLHQMQEFDQQIAPARAHAEQRLHLGQRGLIQAAALEMLWGGACVTMQFPASASRG